MEEHHVAAVPLDEGADRRPVAASHDEVALPVTDAQSGCHDQGAMLDELGGCHEPDGPFVPPTTAFAPGPTRAQLLGELPAQTASGRVVDRLVDRLVTEMPAGPVGMLEPEPGADLFGAPFEVELVLHDRAELTVGRQPPGPAS